MTPGEAARDRALRGVGDHAPEEWMSAAMEAVERLAGHRRRFTTDAVWAILQRQGVGPPPEPRAMGVVMRLAKGLRLVEPTGEHVQSARPENHARPIRVWRSMIGGSNEEA